MSYSLRHAFWKVEAHIAEICFLESGRSHCPRHAFWKVEGHIIQHMLSGKWKVIYSETCILESGPSYS